MGNISDFKGAFSIAVNDSLPLEIIVSALGYKIKAFLLTKRETTLLLTPLRYDLGDINVYSSTNPYNNVYAVRSKQRRKFAGASKDIFRSVMMLPGVSTNNLGSAQYNVRGGTYDENPVLIDGIRVNEPFHLKIEPPVSLGVFNLDMVESTTFGNLIAVCPPA